MKKKHILFALVLGLLLTALWSGYAAADSGREEEASTSVRVTLLPREKPPVNPGRPWRPNPSGPGRTPPFFYDPAADPETVSILEDPPPLGQLPILPKTGGNALAAGLILAGTALCLIGLMFLKRLRSGVEGAGAGSIRLV